MDYKKVFAIQRTSEDRWTAIYPTLDQRSGLYVLTRTDDNGFRYAYIGQAKHILQRLGQHLTGYQHIDLSIRKHGIRGDHSWKIEEIVSCDEDHLNEAEQEYIRKYADMGYQLRNKTAGSQGEGKDGLDVDHKPAKGYYDGLRQGRKNAIKEIGALFDKYLDVSIKGDPNKVKERKLEEFLEMIKDEEK